MASERKSIIKEKLELNSVNRRVSFSTIKTIRVIKNTSLGCNEPTTGYDIDRFENLSETSISTIENSLNMNMDLILPRKKKKNFRLTNNSSAIDQFKNKKNKKLASNSRRSSICDNHTLNSSIDDLLCNIDKDEDIENNVFGEDNGGENCSTYLSKNVKSKTLPNQNKFYLDDTSSDNTSFISDTECKDNVQFHCRKDKECDNSNTAITDVLSLIKRKITKLNLATPVIQKKPRLSIFNYTIDGNESEMLDDSSVENSSEKYDLNKSMYIEVSEILTDNHNVIDKIPSDKCFDEFTNLKNISKLSGNTNLTVITSPTTGLDDLHNDKHSKNPISNKSKVLQDISEDEIQIFNANIKYAMKKKRVSPIINQEKHQMSTKTNNLKNIKEGGEGQNSMFKINETLIGKEKRNISVLDFSVIEDESDIDSHNSISDKSMFPLDVSENKSGQRNIYNKSNESISDFFHEDVLKYTPVKIDSKKNDLNEKRFFPNMNEIELISIKNNECEKKKHKISILDFSVSEDENDTCSLSDKSLILTDLSKNKNNKSNIKNKKLIHNGKIKASILNYSTNDDNFDDMDHNSGEIHTEEENNQLKELLHSFMDKSDRKDLLNDSNKDDNKNISVTFEKDINVEMCNYNKKNFFPLSNIYDKSHESISDYYNEFEELNSSTEIESKKKDLNKTVYEVELVSIQNDICNNQDYSCKIEDPEKSFKNFNYNESLSNKSFEISESLSVSKIDDILGKFEIVKNTSCLNDLNKTVFFSNTNNDDLSDLSFSKINYKSSDSFLNYSKENESESFTDTPNKNTSQNISTDDFTVNQSFEISECLSVSKSDDFEELKDTSCENNLNKTVLFSNFSDYTNKVNFSNKSFESLNRLSVSKINYKSNDSFLNYSKENEFESFKDTSNKNLNENLSTDDFSVNKISECLSISKSGDFEQLKNTSCENNLNKTLFFPNLSGNNNIEKFSTNKSFEISPVLKVCDTYGFIEASKENIDFNIFDSSKVIQTDFIVNNFIQYDTDRDDLSRSLNSTLKLHDNFQDKKITDMDSHFVSDVNYSFMSEKEIMNITFEHSVNYALDSSYLDKDSVIVNMDLDCNALEKRDEHNISQSFEQNLSSECHVNELHKSEDKTNKSIAKENTFKKMILHGQVNLNDVSFLSDSVNSEDTSLHENDRLFPVCSPIKSTLLKRKSTGSINDDESSTKRCNSINHNESSKALENIENFLRNTESLKGIATDDNTKRVLSQPNIINITMFEKDVPSQSSVPVTDHSLTNVSEMNIDNVLHIKETDCNVAVNGSNVILDVSQQNDQNNHSQLYETPDKSFNIERFTFENISSKDDSFDMFMEKGDTTLIEENLAHGIQVDAKTNVICMDKTEECKIKRTPNINILPITFQDALHHNVVLKTPALTRKEFRYTCLPSTISRHPITGTNENIQSEKNFAMEVRDFPEQWGNNLEIDTTVLDSIRPSKVISNKVILSERMEMLFMKHIGTPWLQRIQEYSDLSRDLITDLKTQINDIQTTFNSIVIKCPICRSQRICIHQKMANESKRLLMTSFAEKWNKVVKEFREDDKYFHEKGSSAIKLENEKFQYALQETLMRCPMNPSQINIPDSHLEKYLVAIPKVKELNNKMEEIMKRGEIYLSKERKMEMYLKHMINSRINPMIETCITDGHIEFLLMGSRVRVETVINDSEGLQYLVSAVVHAHNSLYPLNRMIENHFQDLLDSNLLNRPLIFVKQMFLKWQLPILLLLGDVDQCKDLNSLHLEWDDNRPFILDAWIVKLNPIIRFKITLNLNPNSNYQKNPFRYTIEDKTNNVNIDMIKEIIESSDNGLNKLFRMLSKIVENLKYIYCKVGVN